MDVVYLLKVYFKSCAPGLLEVRHQPATRALLIVCDNLKGRWPPICAYFSPTASYYPTNHPTTSKHLPSASPPTLPRLLFSTSVRSGSFHAGDYVSKTIKPTPEKPPTRTDPHDPPTTPPLMTIEHHTPLSADSARALTLFEQAAEKEAHGLHGDALALYRQAYRLDEQVDMVYRAKKVPQAMDQARLERGKNAGVRVSEEAIKNINVEELLRLFEHIPARAPDGTEDNADGVTIKFSHMGLDEVADLHPILPLEHLPDDVWSYILKVLVVTDPEAWFRWLICCKRHAYLGFGRQLDVWRTMCYLVYPNQVWYENVTQRRLGLGEGYEGYDEAEVAGVAPYSRPGDASDLPIPVNPLHVLPHYTQWYQMLKTRPFVKFHGCYISVVNFYSEGGKLEFSSSWLNPVKITTYYRYLRFYPDGTVVKVRTLLEPPKVVPQLSRHNQLVVAVAPVPGSALQPVKDPHVIHHGRWTISSDGEVVVTLAHANKYYRLDYSFSVAAMGGYVCHGKLVWRQCLGTRKRLFDDDDREGEIELFSLKNEKPFKFSRVKSYTLAN